MGKRKLEKQTHTRVFISDKAKIDRLAKKHGVSQASVLRRLLNHIK